MDIKYANAFTEVIELFDAFLSEEEYKKIPNSKINFMRLNANSEYKFEVDYSKDLLEQNISQEAKAVIISLYNTYFADIQQKKKVNYYIMLHDKKKYVEKTQVNEEEQSDSELPENNIENIESNGNNSLQNNSNLPMCVVHENIFTKIFKNIYNWFEKIFNKK